MATPTTEKIDILLMVGRLAPQAEFHWRGNGWGHYDDIGEWRTPDIPKPTEAAIYAEWDVYLAERAATEAEETISQTEMAGFTKVAIQPMLDRIATAQAAILDDHAQIDADLLILAASPTNAQIVQVLKHTINRQNATLNRQDGILNRQERLLKVVSRQRQRVIDL